MRTLNLFVTVILLCLMFLSCEQESLTIQKEPYKDLDEFFQKNEAPIQMFSINANQGATILGVKGTWITFSPYSFSHSNGSLVTGAVTITLREVYDKSDMVLSRISTTDSGLPLKSGGMFFLSATQGNETLTMADGMTYTAQIPSATPDNSMQAFLGFMDTTNRINWTVADTTWSNDTTANGQNLYYGSVLTEASDYVLTSSWLGWWNCDSPIPQTISDKITISSTDNVTDFYTELFILFETNTAVQLYSSGISTYDYAPDGYKATAVVLGLKDSILYSAFVPFTVSNAKEIQYTLQQTTTDDFMAALDALN